MRKIAQIPLLLYAWLASAALWANPVGESLVAGAVDFDRATNTLKLTQHSNRAIVHWDGFSIASGELTEIIQPSSAAAILNRVMGGDLSAIHGQLKANGSVYLINPNGVLIGPNGSIHVGSFVASTLDVSDAAFLGGGDLHFQGGSSASIRHEGRIDALGGDVFLIAEQVEHFGDTQATGTVGLAAGRDVVLYQEGSERIAIALDTQGSVDQHGLIQAAHAEIKAAGGNHYALAVNSGGFVRATGAVSEGGRIRLKAMQGRVLVEGALDASKPDSDAVGGSIHVLGDEVGLLDGAFLNASGRLGGGEVLVGGDVQGENPEIQNASGVYMGRDAAIQANALVNGDGGKIVLFSEHATRVYGDLSARGGSTSGNGGFVETSGGWFEIDTVPDVGASNGFGGDWLIDPNNISIDNAAGSTNIAGSPSFTSTADTARIGVALIDAALTANANVTITTAAGGAEVGNITWDSAAALNYTGAGGRTLTLTAHNNVDVQADITSTNSMNIIMNADSDGNGGGVILLSGSLTTGGGALTFQDGVYISGAAAQNLTTSGGNVSFQGQVLLANTSGLSINTTGIAADGDITFSSLLDSGNGYTFVAGALTWTAALAAAKSGTGANVGDTYLATITSAFENSIAAGTAGFAQAWLGGQRSNPNTGAGAATAANGVWRWVAGPEGLEDAGQGRQFYQQNVPALGLGTPDGGAAINGSYTNWNGGEPNNFGGTNLSANESALQFVGTQGRWNDLSHNGGSSLSYVRESNLAVSPLTLNAGTQGTISLNGNIGSNKSIGNLNIQSAQAVNIGASSITIEGAFTIGSTAPTNITAAAGTTISSDTISISSNISGAGKTLTLQPRTTSSTMGLGGSATGTYNLDAAEIGRIQDGFTSLTFGRSDGTGAVDVRALTFNDPVTIQSPSGAGGITLNGGITGAGDASVTLSAGTGGVISNVAAPITTANQNISVTGALTLNTAATFSSGTGAGDITFSSAIDGAQAFTANAGTGTLTFNAAVGATTPLSSMLLSGTQLNVNQAVNTTGNITITTDTIAVDTTNGTLNAGTATLQIQNATAGRQIDLGTNTAGQLALSAAEVGRLTAGTLILGRNDATAAGNISITAAYNPASINNTLFRTTGSFSQTAGSTITLSSLSVNASNGITLSENNAVTSVALQSSNNAITFRDDTGFDIATLDSITGINAGTGALSLTSTSAVTQSAPIVAGNLQLSGVGASYTLTNASNDVNNVAGTFTSLSLSDKDDLTVTTLGGQVGLTATTDLALTADTLQLNAQISGGGSLNLQPFSTATDVGLGDNASASTFHLSGAELALIADGFSSITLGRSDSTGTMSVNHGSDLSFTDPLLLRSGNFTNESKLDLGSNALEIQVGLAGAGTLTANGALVASTVSLKGGSSDDVFNIKLSPNAPANFTATVDGGGGSDQLTADDSSRSVDSEYVVSETQIRRLNPFTINYSNIEAIRLLLGTGEDTVSTAFLSGITQFLSGDPFSDANNTLTVDLRNQTVANFNSPILSSIFGTITHVNFTFPETLNNIGTLKSQIHSNANLFLPELNAPSSFLMPTLFFKKKDVGDMKRVQLVASMRFPPAIFSQQDENSGSPQVYDPVFDAYLFDIYHTFYDGVSMYQKSAVNAFAAYSTYDLLGIHIPDQLWVQ